jgi:predicted PurR-regulated permease PerM
VSLSQATPTAADVTALLDQLRRQFLQLPIEVQQAIADVAARVAATVRDNVLGIAQGTTNVLIDTLLSAVNFISFIVGFLVVPFWLVYVLKDQPVGARALDRLLHPAIRADFWAVLRIVDRTFGRYLRGQLILGLLVGTLVFIGFFVLQLIGVPAIPYQLLLAVVAGLLELVPYFGPVLSAVPAALVALTVSPQAALAVVLMYWAVQQLENYLLVPRVTGDAVDINPAVLMVALIALAQFGFIWLILGAPVLAIARDLFVYAYGRLSEPPRPAGLLPGEPLPIPAAETPADASASNV